MNVKICRENVYQDDLNKWVNLCVELYDPPFLRIVTSIWIYGLNGNAGFPRREQLSRNGHD